MIRLTLTPMTLVATALLIMVSLTSWHAEAAGHSAVRTFSAPWTSPGGEVQVTIKASNYGTFGRVVEILPEGFSYVSSTLSDPAVKDEGRTVAFTLLGDEEFTYTVKAPPTEGHHSFSGVLLDQRKVEETIRGSTQLRVGPQPAATPAPTPELTPTPTPAPTPELTPTPTPAPTPELTPTPTSTPAATPMPTATAATSRPTATSAPATGETVPPEETAEPDEGTPVFAWLIPLLGLGVALILAGFAYRRYRR